MKTLKMLSRLVCAVFLLAATTTVLAAGNSGREFIFSFQQNPPGDDNRLSLYVIATQDTQATVEIAGLNYFQSVAVTANQPTRLLLPAEAERLTYNAISRLGIRVSAQSDVAVFGVNEESGSTDGFMVFPVDRLGTDYMVASYNGLPNYYVYYPTQVAIVGVSDNTQVTITPSASAGGRPVGVPFTITLNRLETYHLAAGPPQDLTGTAISASQPVAVLSGTGCSFVPTSAYGCDHLAEMLPPTTSWGTVFYTVPLAARLNGDVVRVVAAQNGTQVRINDTLVTTLERGQRYETVLTASSEIRASAPVLVAQYSPSGGFDGVHEPFMMVVAPVSEHARSYDFVTHIDATDPLVSANLKHFANVVVPTAAVGSMRLDGNPVDPALFSPIGTSGFSGAQLPIATGQHSLTAAAEFGLNVYGFNLPFNANIGGPHLSYGFVGGYGRGPDVAIRDSFSPNIRIMRLGDTLQGVATDSEDIDASGALDAGEDLNANGLIDFRSEDLNGDRVLDAGEDSNGNGVLDEDTGLSSVELEPGATNLQLTVLPFPAGALTADFTVSLVDPMAPGSGTVRAVDRAGNVRSVPVSLAAQPVMRDVRVVSTVPTTHVDIDMNSFSTPPYSVSSAGDMTRVEWRFDTFPANLVEKLGFDVVARNLVPGEERTVSNRLELSYVDVNGTLVTTELGRQAIRVLASVFDATIATDNSRYGPNDTVHATATVRNLGSVPATGSVRATIIDANGVPVSQSAVQPPYSFAPGETRVFAGFDFAVAGILGGSYRARVEVLGSNGNVVMTAFAPFSIGASSDPNAPVVSLRTVTDRSVYNVTDRIDIRSLVSNVTTNTIVDNARLRLRIKDSSAAVIFAHENALAQLSPGALRDALLPYVLNNAPLGTYRVEGEVVDADTGNVLAASATQYQVIDDPAKSLTGAVSVAQATVERGTSQLCSYTVTNRSTNVRNSVTLRLSVAGLAMGTTVETASQVVNLGANGTQTTVRSVATHALAPADYACVLEALIDGTYRPLGYAVFKVIEPPIRIGASMAIGEKGRLLILLDGTGRCEKDNDDSAGESHNGKSKSRADDGSTPESCAQDTDPHGPKTAPGLAAQRSFLETLLTQAGWSYTITDTAEAFTREFHTGGYAAYALLSEQVELSDRAQKELREAVFRGEGLIVAGSHDARNLHARRLQEALGIKLIGHVLHAAGIELTESPLQTTGIFDLTPKDEVLRIKRTTAQSAAAYLLGGPARDPEDRDDCCDSHRRYQERHDRDGQSPHGRDDDDHKDDEDYREGDREKDECDGHPERYLDAITLNAYGAGKALFAGFDLLAYAAQAGNDSLTAKALLAALGATHPAPLTARPGGVLPITLTLQNQGIATTAIVAVPLPNTVTLVDGGGGTVLSGNDGTLVVWTVDLALNQEKPLRFAIRLPTNEASVTLDATVSAAIGNTVREITRTSLAIGIETVPSLDQLRTQAEALASSLPEDRKALNQVIKRLDEAIRAHTADKAVAALLKATDALLAINASNATALRQALDERLHIMGQQLPGGNNKP